MKLLYWLCLLAALFTVVNAAQADEDIKRRLKNEPDFARIFTNETFVNDPEYIKSKAEFDAIVRNLAGTPSRSNARVAAADSHEGHGKHYCVGVAWNPHRIRIFENRMECSIEGWTTQVAFCIPKAPINSKSFYRQDMCVGIAHNPTRSMVFNGETNCNRNGWTHDFQMPVQEVRYKDKVHHLQAWHAYDPHRMNISPGGSDEHNRGWTYSFDFPVYTTEYPMTPTAIKAFKPHLADVVAMHKRDHIDIGKDTLRITLVHIAYRALEYLTAGMMGPQQGDLLQRISTHQEIQELELDIVGRLFNVEIVRISRTRFSIYAPWELTLQMNGDGQRLGVIRIQEGINYGSAILRQAFLISMMEREMVTIGTARDAGTGRTHVMAYFGNRQRDLGTI